jgi:hypothetical protein
MPLRGIPPYDLIPIPIHNVPDETDGFFRLARRVRSNSQAIDDDPNAARRKKTRFHGTLWVGIGINGMARKPNAVCATPGLAA